MHTLSLFNEYLFIEKINTINDGQVETKISVRSKITINEDDFFNSVLLILISLMTYLYILTNLCIFSTKFYDGYIINSGHIYIYYKINSIPTLIELMIFGMCQTILLLLIIIMILFCLILILCF